MPNHVVHPGGVAGQLRGPIQDQQPRRPTNGLRRGGSGGASVACVCLGVGTVCRGAAVPTAPFSLTQGGQDARPPVIRCLSLLLGGGRPPPPPCAPPPASCLLPPSSGIIPLPRRWAGV